MRAVVQRVDSLQIRVGDEILGEMGAGLLAFVGVGHADDEAVAEELAQKLVNLRIFEDETGSMMRSLKDTGGSIGIVSQFTLYGDVRKGRRPSFSAAAPPETAEPLLEHLVNNVLQENVIAITGRFGAMMHIKSVNAGPVTILIDTEKSF